MSDLRARLLNIICEINIISQTLENQRHRAPPCCIKLESNKMSCSFLRGLPPEEFYKECLICLNEIKETIAKIKNALPASRRILYE